MAEKKREDQFSPEEAQRRFEAALRGARIAGHKPMKSATKNIKDARQKRNRRRPHK